jgi:hypothetical protein
MVFLQNSLCSLAGNFGAEFDPEQGIRIREQGIWRSPENPNPARLCGARARLAAAALAGAAAASLDDKRNAKASAKANPPKKRG